MSSPNEMERKEMLLWLVHRYSIPIDHETYSYIVTETANYNLTDLNKLVHMANKERIRSNSSNKIETRHVAPILGM
jgi:hypothetical protein